MRDKMRIMVCVVFINTARFRVSYQCFVAIIATLLQFGAGTQESSSALSWWDSSEDPVDGCQNTYRSMDIHGKPEAYCEPCRCCSIIYIRWTLHVWPCTLVAEWYNRFPRQMAPPSSWSAPSLPSFSYPVRQEIPATWRQCALHCHVTSSPGSMDMDIFVTFPPLEGRKRCSRGLCHDTPLSHMTGRMSEPRTEICIRIGQHVKLERPCISMSELVHVFNRAN